MVTICLMVNRFSNFSIFYKHAYFLCANPVVFFLVSFGAKSMILVMVVYSMSCLSKYLSGILPYLATYHRAFSLKETKPHNKVYISYSGKIYSFCWWSRSQFCQQIGRGVGGAVWLSDRCWAGSWLDTGGDASLLFIMYYICTIKPGRKLHMLTFCLK